MFLSLCHAVLGSGPLRWVHPEARGMQRTLSRRSFSRGVGALGAMALTGRQVQLEAQGPTPRQAPDGVADWPEWRGRGRLGVWTESGILDRFPAAGLQVMWRAAGNCGVGGPG